MSSEMLGFPCVYAKTRCGSKVSFTSATSPTRHSLEDAENALVAAEAAPAPELRSKSETLAAGALSSTVTNRVVPSLEQIAGIKPGLRGDEIEVPIDKYLPFLKKLRPKPDPAGEKHPYIQ